MGGDNYVGGVTLSAEETQALKDLVALILGGSGQRLDEVGMLVALKEARYMVEQYDV